MGETDPPNDQNDAGEATGPQPSEQPDRQAQPVDGEQPPRLSFPVVGFGASAGGLESFIQFIEAMRPDSGMALVLVQHLPPERESLMADVLSTKTAMPVQQVEDGMEVKADHLYVIRPGHVLTLHDGRFHLGAQLGKRAANRPVDDFFKSLAEEQRERAIAVVLSGMGSNGSAGAQAVKAVGGLVIAQDPETAQFPSMPRHLIDQGYADYILSPSDIPEVLLQYAGHPYSREDRKGSETALHRDQHHLREILAVLRTRVRTDFGGYKKPTLLRRVQRRMGLARTTDMGEYAKLLRQSPSEVSALADDLLIHVTGFFRDNQAWETLRHRVVVPLIAHREAESEVRAWVTACSSGEEAYSLAMLLVEEAERAGKPLEIKVFATDMAERPLGHARAGVYPGGIESEISPERLERFFEKDDGVYRIRQFLRECVVFAPQNVLQDPPFSRLDIVTCRNLLIYLEPDVQQRVLNLMHFGLREGGALFLGSSETISGADDLFELVDKRARIFRRIGPTRHGSIDFPVPHFLRSSAVGGGGGGGAAGANTSENRVAERRLIGRPSIAAMTQRTLLEHHTPAAITVDRDYRIIFFHGNTRPFIEQPPGEPSRELMVLLREGLRGAARLALHRAAAENGPVSNTDGWLEMPGNGRVRVAVTASPVSADDFAPDYFVLSFEQQGVFSASPETAESLAGSNDELRRTRDELQTTIEELQTSNEELKAANEEVTSINEELQSSNEELETSKEEMQSLNEELTTVNAQLQVKMEELTNASNDLSALLTSTSIAVLFLDTQLRIRRYTPAIRDLMDLISTDAGRPVADLHRKFDDPDLENDAHDVLERLVPIEREVKAANGSFYARRALPYRTADNRIDGVVITFVEITVRKQAEGALREREIWLRGQREALESALSNEPLEASLGALVRTATQVLGPGIRAAFYLADRDENGLHHVVGMPEDYAAAIDGFRIAPESLACGLATYSGEPVITRDVMEDPRWASWRELAQRFDYRGCWSFPIHSAEGKCVGTLAVYSREPREPSPHDLELASLLTHTASLITSRHAEAEARKQAAGAARRAESHFQTIANLVPDLLWSSRPDGYTQWCNNRWLEYTGQTREQALGWGWTEAIHPRDREASAQRYREAIESGNPLQQEHRLRRHDGQYRWFLLRAEPLKDEAGKIITWFGSATDIQEQRTAMDVVREREVELRLMVEGAQNFAMLMLDPQGKITTWNVGAQRLLGFEEKEAVGKDGAIIFTPEDRAAGMPEAEIAKARKDGCAIDERWHIKKDGSIFWGSGVLTALNEPDGYLRGFVKILRDETARKQAEQSLQSAKEAAELANRTKDEFLATLSHELRTPLSAILIWSKMLQKSASAPELVEGMDAIARSAEAQKQLIDDLLDMSRITAGKLRLELRLTELAPLVRNSVEAIVPTAQVKNITVVSTAVEDVGLVQADPHRLRQVIWNLLTNAVKFTQSGGRVEISLRRRGAMVEFSVTDNGKGISEAFLPHVFEPFRQADSSTERAYGGLGLGLAIAKQLVEQHGGTISVASPGPGKGSTFKIDLPLPAVRHTRGVSKIVPKAPPPRTLPSLKDVRILLVEDEAETRKAIETLLVGAGAVVTGVESAAAAATAYKKSRPDLLITDIAMPGEDGYVLLQRLRQSDRKSHKSPVPAVALTAFARDEDRENALAAGFDRHIGKPVEPDQLLSILQDLVAGQ